jgi:hypothetical protein
LTVHSVTVANGYLGFIRLSQNLTLSGDTAPNPSGIDLRLSQFTMPSSHIIGAGGKLILDNRSIFYWQGGTLDGVTVQVNGTPADTATFNVVPLAGSTPQMINSIIDVNGSLNWSGDVNVLASNPPSLVHILPAAGAAKAGMMTIDDSARWGDPAGNPNYFTLWNEGTVQTSGPSGSARISGKYSTGGTTVVGSGWTLDLLGVGEQIAASGVFQLNGGTVKMSSTAPGTSLFVQAGVLAGSGTVQGSVLMGDAKNTPILIPGGRRRPEHGPDHHHRRPGDGRRDGPGRDLGAGRQDRNPPLRLRERRGIGHTDRDGHRYPEPATHDHPGRGGIPFPGHEERHDRRFYLEATPGAGRRLGLRERQEVELVLYEDDRPGGEG